MKYLSNLCDLHLCRIKKMYRYPVFFREVIDHLPDNTGFVIT